jgi:hypothetical protein
MMQRPDNADRVWELVDSVCNAEPDVENIRNLNARLQDDPVACNLYNDYCDLHAALIFRAKNRESFAAFQETFSASPALPPTCVCDAATPASTGYFISDWSLAYLVATVVLCVGLTIAGMTHVSQPDSNRVASESTIPQNTNSQSSDHGPASSDAIVARVTGMVECQWENTRPGDPKAASLRILPPRLQSPVLCGDKFALRSGLLEITYDTGAKVILQGPVTYEADSPTGGYLAVGKLTARVEKRSAPASRLQSPVPLFAVRTPTAIVTDLGTEFGVNVDETGQTISYVFRGLIEVSPHGQGKMASKVQLKANDAAVVTVSGRVEPRKTEDGSRFVRQLDNGTVRPFSDVPGIDKGRIVFSEPFTAEATDFAVDCPGLAFRRIAEGKSDASGDAVGVHGGFLELRHGNDSVCTQTVVTKREFSGRMIVSVDIGGDNIEHNASHLALLLGDMAFQFHPGYSEKGMRGAFRATKIGKASTDDNTDMGYTPCLNLLHHLFIYYDGRDTFRVHFINAGNSKAVFEKTIVQPDCEKRFSVGVYRSGGASTGWFDNLQVIQLPDENGSPSLGDSGKNVSPRNGENVPQTHVKQREAR